MNPPAVPTGCEADMSARGVTFPVDPRGLVARAPLGNASQRSPGGIGMFAGALAQQAITRLAQSQDTLFALAKDTGGTALVNANPGGGSPNVTLMRVRLRPAEIRDVVLCLPPPHEQRSALIMQLTERQRWPATTVAESHSDRLAEPVRGPAGQSNSKFAVA